jgi:Fur family zinc uptake transcriptional regulator
VQHEQLLLICKICHDVEERAAAAVMLALSEELQAAAFVVHHKALEIHGICADCASEVDA